MAVATDAQVQIYVNTRIRPMCEQIRALKVALEDYVATFDDVFQALNVANPTWIDNRTDAPPHLATPGDILSVNTLLHNVRDAITNDPQYQEILKLCVRPAQL